MLSQSLRRTVLYTLVLGAAACGTPATTDSGVDAARTDVPAARDTAAPDVATDVPMTMPDGAMPDVAPADAADATTPPVDVATDTADAAVGTDVATDAPHDAGPITDPCAAGAIVDLNTAGTRAGMTTTYMGDNSASHVAPLDGGCGQPGDEIALSYTAHADARLQVSTDNAGTPVNFDTVVFALDHCAASGATALGCNDDNHTMGSSRTSASTFTTGAPVALGTTVYIVVAGFSPPASGTGAIVHGPFTLTVTEIPAVAVGGACDPAGVTSVCATGSACLTSGTSSVCVADGAPGAECNPTGAPCNTGLVCNGSPTDPRSRCIAAVPIGGTCDPTGVANACVATSHCISSGRGSMCVADGAAGAQCSTVPPACGMGLGCSGSPSDPASRCITAVAAGAACDPTGVRNICAAASHCMTSGTTSTCVVDGTLHAHCATNIGLSCNPGLGCTGTPSDDAARCVAGVASGGACVPGSATTACLAGDACVTIGAAPSCRGYAPTMLASPTLLDACATGTTLAVTDAGDGHSTAAQTLPFTLAFLGTDYTRIWPDTNGYAALGTTAPADDVNGVGVPDPGEPAPAIAPFWDDLVLGTTGRICTLATGTTPNRSYVIEWQGVSRLEHTPTVALTFEIVLHENNTIDFVYAALTPTTGADAPFANGTHAAIGMQLNGTVGLQYFSVLAAPFGIRWTPM